jgi:hypothetical protein
VAFGQVVENGNLMPAIQHFLDTNAADVTRTSRDQNFHGHPYIGTNSGDQ